MNIIAKYIHGSRDSTDIDTYYVVDTVPSFQESKLWCDSIKNENANLISIKDGVVNACYKGVPDECNNSLYTTYNLHEQEYPLLIDHMVERDKGLKYIRAVRIILSHLSRSKYRPIIKSALKDPSLLNKIKTLNRLDLYTIDFDELSHNRMSKSDILKVIAFQLGQSTGLMSNKEFYTKNDIAKYFGSLRPFLYREPNLEPFDFEELNEYLYDFIDDLRLHIDNENNGIVTFIDGNKYDVLKEKHIKN